VLLQWEPLQQVYVSLAELRQAQWRSLRDRVASGLLRLEVRLTVFRSFWGGRDRG
jgi:hypothetical protein